MYAEIKYDGERVEVHKQGDRFEYFSRSLKPVGSHKVRAEGVVYWNVMHVRSLASIYIATCALFIVGQGVHINIHVCTL